MNTYCAQCKKDTENIDSKKKKRFHYDDYYKYYNLYDYCDV